MKHKLFMLFFLSIFLNQNFAQNSNFIIGNNYYFGNQSPLPTFPGGYNGQAAKGAHNIITDQSGKIVFFIVDDAVYSRKGKLITILSAGNAGNLNGICSETVVVPVPNSCNDFYILSSHKVNVAEDPLQVTFATGGITKIRVVYDANDEVLPESGTVIGDLISCQGFGSSFATLFGSDYYLNNNQHDERPMIAVASIDASGAYPFYVANANKLFSGKLTASGIQINQGFLDLNSLYSNNALGVHYLERQEMEAIVLPNGNLRLAVPIERTDISISPYQHFKSVLILDINGNNVIASKSIDYTQPNLNQNVNLWIKGVELSPNGDGLYVAHNLYGSYQSSLDYFDLTQANPTRIVVEASNKFEFSQIEATSGNAILIPHQNGLAKISNANNPSFPSDYNPNYFTTSIPLSIPSFSDPFGKYKIRLMQDQVDGMNYGFIQPNDYGGENVVVSSSATWQPNTTIINTGNPLVSNSSPHAYIQDELRVKAGTTLTINNMVLHFGNRGRLVIENGTGSIQGGRLILNNTVLTNDGRCSNNGHWLGVEVWGNRYNTNQGTMASSLQGRLEMTNNSKIENAYVGVLLGGRNTTIYSPNTFCQGSGFYQFVGIQNYISNNSGGIVQSTNSFLENNKIGAYFRPYISSLDNVSYFQNCSFNTTPTVLNGLNLETHIKFEEVNGVKIYGSDFINSNNTGVYLSFGNNLGKGITSMNSTFYVNALGPNFITGITDKSKFINLYQGIYASSANASTFTIDRSIFSDCFYGISAYGVKLERVTRNIFEVREHQLQTAGGLFVNCDGYKIEENLFYEKDNNFIQNGMGNSYGLNMVSSGINHNEVYKNTFHHLKVGGQSEKINGQTIGGNNVSQGLQWLCNTFQAPIYLADLGVNGIIDYQQGYTDNSSIANAISKAAKNVFSLSGEDHIAYPQHDLMMYPGSQSLVYAHLADNNQVLDNYSPLATPVLATYQFNPVYSSGNVCPSKIISKPISLSGNSVLSLKTQVIELEQKINPDQLTLINLILNSNNPQATKLQLLDKSPFLGDEVLEAYLVSNAPAGMKKEVLIANSKLSDYILSKLASSNLPNGTKKQILNEQQLISKREIYLSDLAYLKSQYTYDFNDFMSSVILDTVDNLTLDQKLSVFNVYSNLETEKMRLELLLQKGDLNGVNQIKTQLQLNELEAEYIALKEIQSQIRPYVSTRDANIIDNSIRTNLEVLNQTSVDQNIKTLARLQLNLIDTLDDVEAFLPIQGPSAMMLMQASNTSNQNQEIINESNIEVYPNPSNGMVQIDYFEREEMDMSIQIFDLSGKLMFTSEFKNTNGETINLSHLQNGTYLIKVSNGTDLNDTRLIQLSK